MDPFPHYFSLPHTTFLFSILSNTQAKQTATGLLAPESTLRRRSPSQSSSWLQSLPSFHSMAPQTPGQQASTSCSAVKFTQESLPGRIFSLSLLLPGRFCPILQHEAQVSSALQSPPPHTENTTMIISLSRLFCLVFLPLIFYGVMPTVSSSRKLNTRKKNPSSPPPPLLCTDVSTEQEAASPCSLG